MNEQRLLQSIEYFAKHFNATPNQGVTRFSWSEADKNARDWLYQELKAINLEPWNDGIGNLRATYKGKNSSQKVIIGSHLDTVLYGGPLDGTYGVLASLEVLRSFYDKQYIPSCDIEFIAFAEEEGSNFGNTCLGSKAICGMISNKELENISNEKNNLLDLLKDFGLKPENLVQEQINPSQVKAFLEIHIEQNTKLEKQNIGLGIVSSITAMQNHEITIHGISAHAANPMQGRKDPMLAFTAMAYAFEKLWQEKKLCENLSFTIGKIHCQPNVANIIPNKITFNLDLRHIDVSELEKSWDILAKTIHEAAKSKGLEVEVKCLSNSGGVPMSSMVQKEFAKAAEELGLNYANLPSGPAHDAACMGKIVESGLLFVPSKDGLSHCREEYTAPEYLINGCKVFEQTIYNITVC